jgi:hypothetical protein
MITAKEAKQFYDDSGYEVEQFLTFSVETEVMNAAKGGKRNTIIHLDSLEPFSHLDQVITPLQKAVVIKLRELGYHTQINLYGDHYVPRGLADDDGKGPRHQNYGIYISW